MQPTVRMLTSPDPAIVPPSPPPLDPREHLELERSDAWRTWQLFWLLERRRRILARLRHRARL